MTQRRANGLDLSPKERIIFRVHPHVISLLFPLLLLTLLLLVFNLYICPDARSIQLDGRCVPIVDSVFAVADNLVILDWLMTWYTLTNRRVIREQGIISRSATEIALEDIQDVRVKQDVVGRFFGYGDVLIESAGTKGLLSWLAISNPVRVKRRLQRARS